MLSLRPYQNECLEKIHTLHSKGKHRQLIHLPTAAGKTVIFANLIKQTGLRTLVLAHTCELLEQAKSKINMICPGLDVGIINGNTKCFDSHVVVSSVQSASVAANLAKLESQKFDLVIADEAHHFATKTSRNVLSSLGFGQNTTKLLVGFTATPFRSDGKGLGEVFDVIAYEKSIKEMIDEGYLCTPRGLKIATDIDFSNVKTADGDFQTASLATVMNTPEMNEVIVNAYLNNALNCSAICFGVNVDHAIKLSEKFSSAGISSKAIYGDMPSNERAAVLKEYHSGSITVLCNCNILIEGVDVPHTSCVIVAKPTKSKGLYQQIVGRGLRLFPNKRECIILDCNDLSHNICSSALLLSDAECKASESGKYIIKEKKKLIEKLPTKLNQKLKSAIINFDPLGESFSWEREGKGYFLKGVGKLRLQVIPNSNENYQVTCIDSMSGKEKQLASELSFEYAFATAEDFAKQNRSLFVISDRDASWRNLPISDKQKALIQSRGYKAGIDGLTRGQASQLIESGALKRAI